MTISTLLILAVHRTHEPCIWPSSPRVLHSSVVRVYDRCTEGHTFNSCRGLRFFFFVLSSWHVDDIMSHFFTEVKIYMYHHSIFIKHHLILKQMHHERSITGPDHNLLSTSISDCIFLHHILGMKPKTKCIKHLMPVNRGDNNIIWTAKRWPQPLNRLNLNIEIQILICYPYTFSTEVVGRICWSINN